MAGVFSMSFIRRWARSRAQRAESTWTACGLCDGADYRCTRWDASNRAGRQAVEDSSMGTRVCAGHWKEEERRQEHCCTTPLLYGPTPNACRLASCTQGWLPSIPTPAHAQAPPDEGRRRYCRAACVTLLSSIACVYTEQVSQGRRRVRRRGKRCLLHPWQARAWSNVSRQEILPSKDPAVFEYLTRTHARTHATSYRKHNPPLQGHTYPSHATHKRLHRHPQ